MVARWSQAFGRHMADVLGKSGVQTVSSLFAYDPMRRLSPRGVLDHPFITVGDFPLMGLCNEVAISGSGFDARGYGRPVFGPLVVGTIGQSLLAGERHRWRIRVRELER